VTTRSGGEEFDTEGNPRRGEHVYLGRKGLLEPLVHLRNETAALQFLQAHPANRLWRCYLGEVTEMDVTQPAPSQLIVRDHAVPVRSRRR